MTLQCQINNNSSVLIYQKSFNYYSVMHFALKCSLLLKHTISYFFFPLLAQARTKLGVKNYTLLMELHRLKFKRGRHHAIGAVVFLCVSYGEFFSWKGDPIKVSHLFVAFITRRELALLYNLV